MLHMHAHADCCYDCSHAASELGEALDAPFQSRQLFADRETETPGILREDSFSNPLFDDQPRRTMSDEARPWDTFQVVKKDC